MRHMRSIFASELHAHMKKDKRLWVLTGDLGYVLWDSIAASFPTRFVNTGAAETTLIDCAVGLALSGKKPVVYSISSFLLTRPFESIRNYINNEKIPVILVGSGRDKDYEHEGFSHWAIDDRAIMQMFPNIDCYWPQSDHEIPSLVKHVIHSRKPSYVNLCK